MDAIVGFVAGYLFATKFGLLNRGEIEAAWKRIRKSPETRAVFSAGFHIFRHFLTQYVNSRR